MEEIDIFQCIETFAAFKLQQLISCVKIYLIFSQHNNSTQSFKGKYLVIHCDPVAIKSDSGFFLQELLILIQMTLAQPNCFFIDR